MDIAPQLEFAGNCREAFFFYASLLGGEVTVMNTMGDTPDVALAPGSKPGPPDMVRFAEIRFGQSVLRGNDLADDDWKSPRGFSLSLHLPSAGEAHRVSDGLAKGGRVTVPLAKVDWAASFGMVTDRFGIPWLILGLKE